MTRIVPLQRRHAAALALSLAAVAMAPAAAMAVEGGGSVVGTVAPGDPAKRPEPPVRTVGFVRRARNALKAPRPVDPTPRIVVVLDGATPPAEDSAPPGQPVRYTIIGESFDTPVLPVVVGSLVEIKNAGKGSPRLYSPTRADLVESAPISPRGERKTKKIEAAYKPLELRDRDSAHLSGQIVGFPHRYFAKVGPDGKFEIKDVAPGLWKVRVWYQGGWVDMAQESVEVVAKRESKPVRLSLPPRLVIVPAR